MKKQKRWVSLLILSVFLLGVTAAPGVAAETEAEAAVAADGAVEETAAEAAELELTLEQALALALEHNTGIKMAEAARQLKKIDDEEARQAARDARDSGNSSYPGIMARNVNPKITAMKEELAEQQKQSAINGVLVGVESAYYGLLQAQDNAAIGERSLKRAEEQLRQANVRLEAGTASKIEVMQAEAAVAGAQVNLLAVQNALGQSQRSLNQLLAQEVETPVKAIDVIAFEAQEYDVTELLTLAREHDAALLEAQVNRDAAALTSDLLKKHYGGTWSTREANQGLVIAELTLQNAEAALISNVHRYYETYGTLTGQYVALTKVLELRQEAYRLQQLTYEVGLSTFEEVNQSADDLQEAEAALAKCVHDYNVCKSMFKYNVYDFGSGGGSGAGNGGSSSEGH